MPALDSRNPQAGIKSCFFWCPARDSEVTLQRLPEPSLKQRSKRAADMDTVTAAQDEIEFPVRGRLQMQNAVDVDDGRAMHANEAARWMMRSRPTCNAT